VGSAYVQLERVSGLAVVAAIPVGLLATALLVVNNLRDIPTDVVAGKRTLAVLLGDARTRMLYVGLVAVAFLVPLVLAALTPWALLALLVVPLARGPLQRVRRGVTGLELVPVLTGTGKLQLAYAVLLTAGLSLGG